MGAARWGLKVGVIAVLLAATAIRPVSAHERSESFSHWSYAHGELSGVVTVRSREATRLALPGEGIGALLTALGERVAQSYRTEAPVLTRARHRQSLEEAKASLRRALAATLPELRAEDLRLALRSLGQITGVVDVEDLLDVIFRDFCIGK